MEVTRSKVPFLTTIEDGELKFEGERCVRIPASELMWFVAPESKYHSCDGGVWSVMVLKLLASVYWSQYGGREP